MASGNLDDHDAGGDHEYSFITVSWHKFYYFLLPNDVGYVIGLSILVPGSWFLVPGSFALSV